MAAGPQPQAAPKERKRRKNVVFSEAHQFEPIAVKTMGMYGGGHLEGNWPPTC